MENKEIFRKVKTLIAEILELDIIEIEDELTGDVDLIENFNIDSLDYVQLIIALEEDFNIELNDNDFENLLTINEIVSYIEEKITNRI